MKKAMRLKRFRHHRSSPKTRKVIQTEHAIYNLFIASKIMILWKTTISKGTN